MMRRETGSVMREWYPALDMSSFNVRNDNPPHILDQTVNLLEQIDMDSFHEIMSNLESCRLPSLSMGLLHYSACRIINDREAGGEAGQAFTTSSGEGHVSRRCPSRNVPSQYRQGMTNKWPRDIEYLDVNVKKRFLPLTTNLSLTIII